MSVRVPLRAIETFVVAARALSLTVAADQLGLTPSAVSRRVSDLELELGVDLFRRRNRRIELTRAGAGYLASVGEAVDRIRAETDALRQDRKLKVIRLSAVSAFATVWLMPRLAKFRRLRPDIDVVLETSTTYIDFSTSDAHAAIRFGRGPWPGLVCERLLDVELTPVCAPSLAPALPVVSRKALDGFTLLSVSPALGLWEDWFRAMGLPDYRPAAVKSFDSMPVVYAAAAAGMGLALGASHLVDPYTASGRLVTAFDDATVATPNSWSLVHRPRDRGWPPLRALSQLLLDEARAV
jgi:LysR family glycine cleavage system transcriptional activator